jgi:hypothetical protein
MPSDWEIAARRSLELSAIWRVCIGAALAATVQSYDGRMEFIRLTAFSHGSG